VTVKLRVSINLKTLKIEDMIGKRKRIQVWGPAAARPACCGGGVAGAAMSARSVSARPANFRVSNLSKPDLCTLGQFSSLKFFEKAIPEFRHKISHSVALTARFTKVGLMKHQ
jgi:hypothetical protein